MDLGFSQAGYNILWANDFVEKACQTYAHNIGDHVVWDDITKVNLKKIPDVDIIIGGFPCQDFSMIWKRGGIETDRGNLYRYFVEAVRIKIKNTDILAVQWHPEELMDTELLTSIFG